MLNIDGTWNLDAKNYDLGVFVINDSIITIKLGTAPLYICYASDKYEIYSYEGGHPCSFCEQTTSIWVYATREFNMWLCSQCRTNISLVTTKHINATTSVGFHKNIFVRRNQYQYVGYRKFAQRWPGLLGQQSSNAYFAVHLERMMLMYKYLCELPHELVAEIITLYVIAARIEDL